MNSIALSCTNPSPLSRRHRALIALYSLASNAQDRLEILRLNDVTEEDINEFKESWQVLCGRPLHPNYLLPRLPSPDRD